jgi:serine/threonine protein kinase
MSDTPPRPAKPDLGELVETANPGLGPSEAHQSTLANAAPKAPTIPDLPSIPGYELLAKIGEGGMGAVFRARKVMLDREVALKTMRPDVAAVPGNRERFLREAKAAAKVRHPNIVEIFHVDLAPDGTPYIELEFLKGEPLDARLKREPAAPLALILQVAREVAAGLAKAHDAGLIHRDVKPANVWLEGDPAAVGIHFERCKVLDFGLARFANAKDEAELTKAGAVLGTPAYMSPEQARGQPVDFRTDLFSLGVMLYRMAAAAPPFTGSNVTDLMFAIVNDEPRSVYEAAPDLPPALLALIQKLMSKNPAGRPNSAAEVVAAVAAIERAAPPDAPRTVVFLPAADGSSAAFRSLPVAPQPPSLRDRAAVAAGAAALMPVVAAAAAGVWYAAAPWATGPWAVRTFLLTTALAWAAAVACQIPARDGWLRWARYASQFALGGGIAAVALWADGWSAPAGAAAAAVAYALYFGLAACAVRWWWERLCDVAAGRAADAAPGGTWWRWFAVPLTLLALWVVWPSPHAPAELAAVVVLAAVAAQAARRLVRPV